MRATDAVSQSRQLRLKAVDGIILKEIKTLKACEQTIALRLQQCRMCGYEIDEDDKSCISCGDDFLSVGQCDAGSRLKKFMDRLLDTNVWPAASDIDWSLVELFASIKQMSSIYQPCAPCQSRHQNGSDDECLLQSTWQRLWENLSRERRRWDGLGLWEYSYRCKRHETVYKAQRELQSSPLL